MKMIKRHLFSPKVLGQDMLNASRGKESLFSIFRIPCLFRSLH